VLQPVQQVRNLMQQGRDLMQQGRDLMQHGCYRRYMYRNVEDEMRLLRAIHYRTGAPVHRASRRSGRTLRWGVRHGTAATATRSHERRARRGVALLCQV
jgi:hypothetical protein